MKELEYQYIPQKDILLISGKNQLSAHEAKHMVQFIINDHMVMEHKNRLICDLRKTTLPDSMPSYNQVSEAMNSMGATNVTLAILVDTPKTTAIAMMLRKKVDSIKMEIFSTEDAALQWLNNETSRQQAAYPTEQKIPSESTNSSRKYTYDKAKNIFRVDYSGDADFKNLSQHAQQLLKNKSVPKDCYNLMMVDNNINIVVSDDINIDEIGRLYDFLGEDVKKIRVAIVTDNLEVHAFVMSLRTKFTFPINRAFSSIEDAYRWFESTY
ncbi:MAG: hypothetical protein ACK5LR_01055 [Mangrovibacterium sp.]